MAFCISVWRFALDDLSVNLGTTTEALAPLWSPSSSSAAAALTVVLDANILLFNIYGARAARDLSYIKQSFMVSVISLLGIILTLSTF